MRQYSERESEELANYQPVKPVSYTLHAAGYKGKVRIEYDYPKSDKIIKELRKLAELSPRTEA